MKLTKERARSPVIENGTFGAGLSYDSGIDRPTFTLSCYGPWVQGKGHEAAYTMCMSKDEMLATVTTWLSHLRSIEQNTIKRAALPTGDREP